MSSTHYVKSVLIRSYSACIFPAFSRIRTEYGDGVSLGKNANQNNSQQGPFLSVQMREYAGKMRTRITPNTDTFYAVIYDSKLVHIFMTW